MQTPSTIEMMISDHFSLAVICVKIENVFFTVMDNFCFHHLFGEFYQKLKIWDREILRVQLEYASQLFAACKSFPWWRTKIKRWLTSTTFLDSQQFKNCFVFNRTVKSPFQLSEPATPLNHDWLARYYLKDNCVIHH